MSGAADGNRLESRSQIAGPAPIQEWTLRNRWRISSVAVLVAVLTTACGGSSEGTSTAGPAAVATVTVALARPTLATGQTTAATAVLRDSGNTVLTNRTVVWSSSAPAVATVSATGTVTAVGAGTANIVATSEGQSGSAVSTVTLAVVASVVTTIQSPLLVGASVQAQVAVRDAGGQTLVGRTVTWSTGNAAVATVSASGLVTGTGRGFSTIVATYDANAPATRVSGTAYVNVFVQGAVPARVTAVSALDQVGPPLEEVVQAPAAMVVDAVGDPVPNVPVTFAVTAGGGSIATATTTTDFRGVAHADRWTFGTEPVQTVHASSGAIPGVDFNGVARPPLDRYDVSLRFLTPLSDAQARAFVHAKNRIESFIVGDVPFLYINLTGTELAAIGCGNVRVTQDVDDVLILAEAAPIDGVNNILGQAGPCVNRSTLHPALGHMKFDTADLEAMEAEGWLEDVILHEMMHVVGFGTSWTSAVLTGPGSANPFFIGPKAVDNFVGKNGGAMYSSTQVPVEAGGGPGTRDAHWRESVLVNELMTGYINRGVNPLSATTIGSLRDIGYTVDDSVANPYTVPAAAGIRAGGLGVEFDTLFMGNDTRSEEPIFVGPDGRPLR